MSQTGNHWQIYHRRWGTLQPPLRPNGDVIAKFVELTGVLDRRVLLLGVTPELALAFDNLVAVDKSATMIANLWPGDTGSRRVVEGDWLVLDGSLGKFTAVVGDGCCSTVAYPGEFRKLLTQVRDHLEPGGRFVCRLYERPDVAASPGELAQGLKGRQSLNFHAFKWKLAMGIAAESDASVPVERILATFESLFPDRANLASETGWPRTDIDTIDTYRGSPAVYCFPTRGEFLIQLPSDLRLSGFHACGTYDLAECCPIVVCERI